jgi:ABC-type nitrate/sulfonate/bicarbonate transport system substrate-binding protein
MINRRNFQLLAAGLVLGSGGFARHARADSKTFRIAFQKGGGNLFFLKERGILERKLAPLGRSVTWTEFQAGPQLLESLNVGAADFGPQPEGPSRTSRSLLATVKLTFQPHAAVLARFHSPASAPWPREREAPKGNPAGRSNSSGSASGFVAKFLESIVLPT